MRTISRYSEVFLFKACLCRGMVHRLLTQKTVNNKVSKYSWKIAPTPVTLSTYHPLLSFAGDCARKVVDSELTPQAMKLKGVTRKLPFFPQQILLSCKELSLPQHFPLFIASPLPPQSIRTPLNFSRYQTFEWQTGS